MRLTLVDYSEKNDDGEKKEQKEKLQTKKGESDCYCGREKVCI